MVPEYVIRPRPSLIVMMGLVGLPTFVIGCGAVFESISHPFNASGIVAGLLISSFSVFLPLEMLASEIRIYDEYFEIRKRPWHRTRIVVSNSHLRRKSVFGLDFLSAIDVYDNKTGRLIVRIGKNRFRNRDINELLKLYE